VADIAFVIKSYASDLLGGGETLVREFSRRLVSAGYAVEILTTCLQDYRNRQEVYPAGDSLVDGVPVRRFHIQTTEDYEQHRRRGQRLAMRLPHTPADEEGWFRSDLHSPGLYRHLRMHGRDYRLVIVLDYFPGLSLYAHAANCGRTAVYPQLHQEPIAYLAPVRRFLDQVDGIMYNCVPERDFAHYQLGVSNPRSAVVGVGVQTDPVGQADRFRRKFGIERPFLLYVGRLDHVKNVPRLLEYFMHYKARSRNDLQLVLMGQGPLTIARQPDVVLLGPTSEDDKYDGLAAAAALCQPSLLESLSIVVLEALGQGTPILVHGGNDVTRYHCLAGNCGLYFYGRDDFGEALEYLRAHRAVGSRFGRDGHAYVQEHYSWQAVNRRLLSAVEQFAA
jgi:glycosyltransferase involved in cell wall biosynthesis